MQRYIHFSVIDVTSGIPDVKVSVEGENTRVPVAQCGQTDQLENIRHYSLFASGVRWVGQRKERNDL
jgi:hypothetical protein